MEFPAVNGNVARATSLSSTHAAGWDSLAGLCRKPSVNLPAPRARPGSRPKACAARGATRAMEVAQDYVEAIADLSASLGEARGGGPGAAAGGDACDGEPHHGPPGPGWVREHQALPRDFPDGRRAAARRGVQAPARDGGGVPAVGGRARKPRRRWTPRGWSITSAPRPWLRSSGAA
jgi:hypothetical protein